MLPYLNSPVGNASSLHSAGHMARSAIETARAQVAELVNGAPNTVIFTSGGSEATGSRIFSNKTETTSEQTTGCYSTVCGVKEDLQWLFN